MIITKLHTFNPLPNYFKFAYHSVETIGGSSPYNILTDSEYGKLKLCSPYEIMVKERDGDHPASDFSATVNNSEYFMFIDVKNPIEGNSNVLQSIRALLYAYEDIESVDVYIGITYLTPDNTIKIKDINKFTIQNILVGYYDLASLIDRDANVTYGNWNINPANPTNYWLTIWIPYLSGSQDHERIGIMMNTSYYIYKEIVGVNTLYNFPTVYNAGIPSTDIVLNHEFDPANLFHFEYSGNKNDNEENASLSLEAFDIPVTEQNNWNILSVSKDNTEVALSEDNVSCVPLGRWGSVLDDIKIISKLGGTYAVVEFADEDTIPGNVNIAYTFDSPIENLINIKFKMQMALHPGVAGDLNLLWIYVMIDGQKKYIDTIRLNSLCLNDSSDPCLFNIHVGEHTVQKVIFEFESDHGWGSSLKYHLNSLQIFEADNNDFSESIYLESGDFDVNGNVLLLIKDDTLYANNNNVLIRTIGYDSNNNVMGASNPLSNRCKF